MTLERSVNNGKRTHLGVEGFEAELVCFVVDIGGVEGTEGETSMLAAEGCLDDAEHGGVHELRRVRRVNGTIGWDVCEQGSGREQKKRKRKKQAGKERRGREGERERGRERERERESEVERQDKGREERSSRKPRKAK